jgi:hypothetical protein
MYSMSLLCRGLPVVLSFVGATRTTGKVLSKYRLSCVALLRGSATSTLHNGYFPRSYTAQLTIRMCDVAVSIGNIVLRFSIAVSK